MMRAVIVLALVVSACAPQTPSPSPTVTVTPEPSAGPPEAWLGAVCDARTVILDPEPEALIRAASALDAAPAWPAGDVIKDPLRVALDRLLEDDAIGSFDAVSAHSAAAEALFGSAEAMCS
jgi:hypothetical protein